jgi:hypothetical protein
MQDEFRGKPETETRPQDAPPADSGEGEPADAARESSGQLVERLVAPVAGALGTVLDAASQAWSGRSGSLARRLRRRGKEPIANLYELHPEARQASPRELGWRFVPLEEIRGTAVAGAAQRGADFLPLKPFRGENWQARWDRINAANERLQPLPPIDLIKFGGSYWVVDGHNRVAATLYADGTGLDAMVTELVPLDGRSSEFPRHLLSLLGEAGGLRAAAQGKSPAMGMRYAEQHAPGQGAVKPARARQPKAGTSDVERKAGLEGGEPLSRGQGDTPK